MSTGETGGRTGGGHSPSGADDAGTSRLSAHRYGKSGIRLVRVTRLADRHELTDVTVDISLEGDFAAAYVEGDNREVLPTDTMRGVVYSVAGPRPIHSLEDFGWQVGRVLVEQAETARRATVTVTAEPWTRIETDGTAHPSAFQRTGAPRRTATVTVWAAGGGDFSQPHRELRGGFRGLTLLRTAGSRFTGFLKGFYTTLEETTDRILATTLDVEWRYSRRVERPSPGDEETRDVNTVTEVATRALVTTFADHDSESLQHTLYAMGEAALAACPEIVEIQLTAPNLHHLPVDLRPYRQENDNTVFVATDAPYGLIEATVTRG